MQNSDIGLIGLGVMGTSLARNIESRGFRVSVYNRAHSGAPSKVEKFKEEFGGGNFFATDSLEDFVASLSRPRKVILMIKAGKAVDEMSEKLSELLSPGDIIIDGGNSDFEDTRRRVEEFEKRGLLYVGMGISGGEEGALKGPSMMASGSAQAWPKIKDIFKAAAAKADDGEACCMWIGPEGSGHFVKMVHNAIEYGDMQLIAEAYWMLKKRLGYSNEKISETFKRWNCADLNSYLIEITSKIFAAKDASSAYVVDEILDCASQKGTGKLAAKSALDEDVPFSLIAEAVFARFLSARLEERQKAEKLFPDGPESSYKAAISQDDIGAALYASKIMSYAQGFWLMAAVSEKNGWNLDFSGIAKIWKSGCIIRSVFLDRISEAYKRNPKLENIIFDEYFSGKIAQSLPKWRAVAADAVLSGTPAPCICAAISAFDATRSGKSSANLLQAQRDYFGAHTYERVDQPRGEFFHTDWLALESGSSNSAILKKD